MSTGVVGTMYVKTNLPKWHNILLWKILCMQTQSPSSLYTNISIAPYTNLCRKPD